MCVCGAVDRVRRQYFPARSPHIRPPRGLGRDRANHRLKLSLDTQTRLAQPDARQRPGIADDLLHGPSPVWCINTIRTLTVSRSSANLRKMVSAHSKVKRNVVRPANIRSRHGAVPAARILMTRPVGESILVRNGRDKSRGAAGWRGQHGCDGESNAAIGSVGGSTLMTTDLSRQIARGMRCRERNT